MPSEDAVIDQILSSYHRVAVVGLSDDPSRPSNEVSSYLIDQGFDVVPVNPNLKTALGRPCHPNLASVPPPLEIVDVFRRSEHAGAVVDEAIAAGAKAVWLQQGVIDPRAAERARAAGILFVMDRCILVEHRRRGHR